MALAESGEMYLETILILSKQLNSVRAIDICSYMGFSKPSVSRALGILKNDGYVTVDASGRISLTDSGSETAAKILDRHEVLSKVLMSLNVSEKTAREDACRMEHVISDETFEAIKMYLSKNDK